MTFSMMLVQFIYSLLSNSLALLSDTLHMFSDVFALTLSFLAIIAIEKWQDHQKTFGYFRLGNFGRIYQCFNHHFICDFYYL